MHMKDQVWWVTEQKRRISALPKELKSSELHDRLGSSPVLFERLQIFLRRSLLLPDAISI
jgi:hypothetical protein